MNMMANYNWKVVLTFLGSGFRKGVLLEYKLRFVFMVTVLRPHFRFPSPFLSLDAFQQKFLLPSLSMKSSLLPVAPSLHNVLTLKEPAHPAAVSQASLTTTGISQRSTAWAHHLNGQTDCETVTGALGPDHSSSTEASCGCLSSPLAWLGSTKTGSRKARQLLCFWELGSAAESGEQQVLMDRYQKEP